MNFKNVTFNRRTFYHSNLSISRFLNILVVLLVCAVIIVITFKQRDDKEDVIKAKQNDHNFLYNDGTDSNDIVKTLNSNVRILCIIFSSKKEIFDRTIHVHNTWAKRCNKHLFLTYYDKFKLPFLDFKLPDTREVLWKKVRLSLKWVYDNELNNYDYILRADDDSYFIMENLRFFLLPFDPHKALYFGARFKENLTSGYMSGGAGYILSREAVRQIAISLDNPDICSQPTNKNFHDDYEIGVCVKNLNITSVDTRDNLGRHRMLPWSPAAHFVTGLQPHHFKWLYYPYNQSTTFECCAEHMISFHYVYKEMLYILDFLTYNAKLIGSIDKQWYIVNAENQELSLLEKLKKASSAVSIRARSGHH